MKTTGTATDYHDLLDKLRTWLTGTVGWTQLRWTAPASLTDIAELWVRGPGAGAGREVYLGFQSGHDVPNGYYGWKVVGSIGFDSSQIFMLQDSVSPGSWFNTWQNSIDYWFWANDRRVIIVAKMATIYQSMYAGFFLPLALPSEYPFPLFISTSYPLLQAYNGALVRNRMFIDPGDGAAYYRRRATSSWANVSNSYASNSNPPYNTSSGANAVLWPHRTPRCAAGYAFTDWNGEGISNIRPTQGGEVPVFQCHLMDPGALAVVGALDGAFAVPGFGRSSEQTITAGSRSFKLFQNVFRTTGRDFFAVEDI
jgi:hypothetical protein